MSVLLGVCLIDFFIVTGFCFSGFSVFSFTYFCLYLLLPLFCLLWVCFVILFLLLIWNISLFECNVSCYRFKFPCLHCFSCISHILISCIFILIEFFHFLWVFLSHGLFRSTLFTFQLIEIFLLFSCCWCLVWFCYGWRTHCICLLFFYICSDLFFAEGVVYFHECFMDTWKDPYSCVARWSVLSVSVRSYWLVVCGFFNSCWFSF